MKIKQKKPINLNKKDVISLAKNVYKEKDMKYLKREMETLAKQ